jgi:hypothetical protein
MKLVAAIVVFTLSALSINSCQSESHYFEVAKQRSAKYDAPRKDYVIVIDYTKNILVNRLYVIDMKTSKSVITSRVSHAYNSGLLYATSFSNKAKTNKSSKGNFITLGTRIGRFGYSMQIKGLDAGINHNANSRAIIFHSTAKMASMWSHGCFATDDETNRQIIDLTKGGCLVCVIN